MVEHPVFGPKKISLFSLIGLAALCIAGGACGQGQSIPGISNIQVGVAQNNLYAQFKATTFNSDVGITMPVPQLPEASIAMTPTLDGSGTVFQFSVALDSLLGANVSATPSGLPNGQPLPDVEGGVLPRWDATIKGLTLSLYLSNQAFGLFVPLDFVDPSGASLPTELSLPINDECGNLIGKVYALPATGGKGSGLFLLLPYIGGQPH